MDSQTNNFLKIMKYAVCDGMQGELPQLDDLMDWTFLEQLSNRHNLFLLFHEVACKYPEYKKHSNYTENIYTALLMIGQQIKKTELFLDLYQCFLKEDLHPIVMKGIVCRQLYGKYSEHRPSGDEDILVRKDEFYKVKEIMEANGFECSQPDVTEGQLDVLQEISFCEKESGFVIEVHTNVMGNDNEARTQMGEYFQDAFERMRTVVIRDVPLATMSHTDHFIFLVLHAFKHFTMNGVGMRQMLDVLLYQREFEAEIDWEMVKNVLEDNRATGYMGDLHAIGKKYLGFEFPVLFETCSPEELLEDMLEVGVFGKQDVAGTLAGRINLSTMDQKGGRLLTLLRAGFPSIEFMVVGAPHLKEKPWMLPIEWVKRWFRFFHKARKYDGNLMKDSIEMSQERKKLLDKYGL